MMPFNLTLCAIFPSCSSLVNQMLPVACQEGRNLDSLCSDFTKIVHMSFSHLQILVQGFSKGDFFFQARATCLGGWYFNTSEWSWCRNYLQTSFCSSKFIFIIMYMKVVILAYYMMYKIFIDLVLLLRQSFVVQIVSFLSLDNFLSYLLLLLLIKCICQHVTCLLKICHLN